MKLTAKLYETASIKWSAANPDIAAAEKMRWSLATCLVSEPAQYIDKVVGSGSYKVGKLDQSVDIFESDN